MCVGNTHPKPYRVLQFETVIIDTTRDSSMLGTVTLGTVRDSLLLGSIIISTMGDSPVLETVIVSKNQGQNNDTIVTICPILSIRNSHPLFHGGKELLSKILGTKWDSPMYSPMYYWPFCGVDNCHLMLY